MSFRPGTSESGRVLIESVALGFHNLEVLYGLRLPGIISGCIELGDEHLTLCVSGRASWTSSSAEEQPELDTWPRLDLDTATQGPTWS